MFGHRVRRYSLAPPLEESYSVDYPLQAGGGPTGTELAAELNDLVSPIFVRLHSGGGLSKLAAR